MNKKENLLLEDLARLYLRLNGFWVQNFIIHSNKQGSESSELDIIAIRLPFHNQNDRGVETSNYLEVSNNKIQIIIGDSKNIKIKKDLKFNDGLRKHEESIIKLIRWIGIADSELDIYIFEQFKKNLNIHRDPNHIGFPSFDYKTQFGFFDIKFIFFCPSLEEWNSEGFKYIHGKELIDFVWKCLNTNNIIDNCSRRYNYIHWREYTKIVEYFKSRNEPGEINDLIENFKK